MDETKTAEPVYEDLSPVTENLVEELESLGELDRVFPEAPASMNFYGVTAAGWHIQFTLRDIDEFNMMRRFVKFSKFLLDGGVKPKSVGREQSAPAGNSAAPTKLCEIHGVDMPERTNKKDGSKFYSHKTDEGWCYGGK